MSDLLFASPIGPLQTAVFELLDGDTTLAGLAPGGVHDQVPEDIPADYVRIGEWLSIEDDDHTSLGRETTGTIHVFTRARGNKPGQAIAARIGALLHRQESALDVAGHRVISVRQEFDQALQDPNPEIRHHVVRFRFVTTQDQE